LKKSPPALMDKPGAPWFERREERSEGQHCTSYLYHQNRRTRKNPEEQAEFYQFFYHLFIYLFIFIKMDRVRSPDRLFYLLPLDHVGGFPQSCFISFMFFDDVPEK
jgi:hypothetical protein